MTLIDKDEVKAMLSEMEWDIEDKYNFTKREVIEACNFICYELERRLHDIKTMDAITLDWLLCWQSKQARNLDVKNLDDDVCKVKAVTNILEDWYKDVKR